MFNIGDMIGSENAGAGIFDNGRNGSNATYDARYAAINAELDAEALRGVQDSVAHSTRDASAAEDANNRLFVSQFFLPLLILLFLAV